MNAVGEVARSESEVYQDHGLSDCVSHMNTEQAVRGVAWIRIV